MSERFFKVVIYPMSMCLADMTEEDRKKFTRIEYVELEEVADAMNIEPEDFDTAPEDEQCNYFDNYAYNMAWGELVNTADEYAWEFEEASVEEVNDYFDTMFLGPADER